MSQQRGDVLADVVVARAIAKVLGSLLVMFQRQGNGLFEIVE
jgi:hypothetical protein